MDWKEMIFGTVGGLALFLYGMGMMSDGLKAAAGDSMRALLAKITKWRVMAMLVGAGVTAVIQSSSATSVIVIGLINAGLLTLKQSICVILGANIGTTITGWLVAAVAELKAFKIAMYAMPLIAVGFGFHLFAKRQRWKSIGMILLGLGILFLGLDVMKDAFADLRDKEHSPLAGVLQMIGDQPILAILAGMAFTVLIQSSSASIAMVIVLAVNGGFGPDPHEALRIAIPFVLGDNIGTTITAQLAALRTGRNGKRTAMAHTLFNVVGVLIILPLVYGGWYARFVETVSRTDSVAINIAVAHSMFNIVAALVVLPFVGLLEGLVMRILPTRHKDLADQPVTLEMHLLDTPALAMDQARRELLRMARTAQEALADAFAAVLDNDWSKLAEVARKEDTVDDFQREITSYLVALSQRSLGRKQAGEFPVLLHGVNDVERIGDHAKNISESAERKMEQDDHFTPDAKAELAGMKTEVDQMFNDMLAALAESDVEMARRALEHEKIINRMQNDLRKAHIRRLNEGNCTAMAGMVFVDLVDNIEKIADHLTNVAQGILHGMQWGTMDDEEDEKGEKDHAGDNE